MVLPECFSGSKFEMLRYIHGKLTSRFHSWHAFFLSTGGKEALIKSVAFCHALFCNVSV